ncbi:hypothetical protein PVAND_010733 [Polypedilum vanderplanki]|uniref:Uncharacterized protein n=1 Tax=Polypedilum vanderplanki TaxID=319348 RepID=A0A9J6CGG4_POLVA|nr:hypothetical protein PVAND_010733 [Polypedilum vanderplanki]
MSKFVILFVLIAFIGASSCICFWPWKGNGVLNVCKQIDKIGCVGVSSDNKCENLVEGPYLSGFTSGNYTCTIFDSTNCVGTSVSVDKDGWNRFPIEPKSLKCPCIK